MCDGVVSPASEPGSRIGSRNQGHGGVAQYSLFAELLEEGVFVDVYGRHPGLFFRYLTLERI